MIQVVSLYEILKVHTQKIQELKRVRKMSGSSIHWKLIIQRSSIKYFYTFVYVIRRCSVLGVFSVSMKTICCRVSPSRLNVLDT